MRKKTAFICDESYFWHNSGDGALFEAPSKYLQGNASIESPEGKRRIKNLLEKSGLMDQLEQIKPVPATREQLMYFHTAKHIENVKALSNGAGGDCGDYATVSPGSYEIAKLSAGGAITAVRTVIENPFINTAYALIRPPGHHAQAYQGRSYCIFNNVAIAAYVAKQELGIKKILILDWDAHHGNGIEDAFYQDDSVLYISIHQERLDPVNRGDMEDRGSGAGLGYNINIPLSPGSGDGVYRYAFEQIVIPVVEKFQPELILVCAGQDGNPFDPLARLMVSAECYRWMTKKTKELANKYSKGRMACIHEGGYCPAYVPFCTHAIVEELSGIETDVEDPFIYAMEGTGYRELLSHQKERVDEIARTLYIGIG